jgi:hypothetical protein
MIQSRAFCSEIRGTLEPLGGVQVSDKFELSQDRETLEPVLQIDPADIPEHKFYIVFNGKLKGKDHSAKAEDHSLKAEDYSVLSPSGEELKSDSSGQYSIHLWVESERKTFSINIVSPTGEVSQQSFVLFFKDWAEFQTEQGVQLKKYELSAGLGITFSAYRQTSVLSFNQVSPTAKVNGVYRLSSRWELSASSYFSPIPVTTSVSGVSLGFLGANVRVGRRLTKSHSQWGVVMSLGGYFLTTFPSATSFGFQNVTGPQIYPTLSYEASSKQRYWMYLKYSPIFNGFQVLSITNAEAAMGVGASFKDLIKKEHSLGVTFDLSQLSLNFSGTTIYMNTYSLGAVYPF